MIKTHEDLKYYLLCDKIALNKSYKHPKLFKDRLWKFQILYRKVEYHYNNKKNIFHNFFYLLLKMRFKIKCNKLNSEFPVNVIGEGLAIWHGQGIIINGNAKIGRNFSISRGCVIGQSRGKFPIIGDNVEMMIDSKVLGGIYIPNDTTIGAGAVVVKSLNECGKTIGGVPAKIISSNENKYVKEKYNRLKNVYRLSKTI